MTPEFYLNASSASFTPCGGDRLDDGFSLPFETHSGNYYARYDKSASQNEKRSSTFLFDPRNTAPVERTAQDLLAAYINAKKEMFDIQEDLESYFLRTEAQRSGLDTYVEPKSTYTPIKDRLTTDMNVLNNLIQRNQLLMLSCAKLSHGTAAQVLDNDKFFNELMIKNKICMDHYNMLYNVSSTYFDKMTNRDVIFDDSLVQERKRGLTFSIRRKEYLELVANEQKKLEAMIATLATGSFTTATLVAAPTDKVSNGNTQSTPSANSGQSTGSGQSIGSGQSTVNELQKLLQEKAVKDTERAALVAARPPVWFEDNGYANNSFESYNFRLREIDSEIQSLNTSIEKIKAADFCRV